MMWLRLVRGELRKLTTTKLPWAFLAVLVVMGAITAIAVIAGTDMDGSKGFIATAADQQSLMAFGWNAMMIAGLFGAIAVSREYAHATVVAMFLTAPRRARAVLAQLTAVLLGGAVWGFTGAALTVAAVAAALPFTHYHFLVSVAAVGQVIGASTFAGAVGAVAGAGLGAVVRNMGGAVTAAVLLLMIIPPIVVQLVRQAGTWIPLTLLRVLSGVAHDVALPSAVVVLAAWAVIPAIAGLITVQKRDVI